MNRTLNALPNLSFPRKTNPAPPQEESTPLHHEPAQPTAQQLAAEQAQAESAANQLHLSKSKIHKRLIARDLACAGWHTTNPAQVTEEYLLPNNASADYILLGR